MASPSALGQGAIVPLIPATAQAGDLLGWAVDLVDDIVVAGAPWHDGACPGQFTCNSGATFSFQRSVSGAWTELAPMRASDEEEGDAFGACVDLSVGPAGTFAAIGAPWEDTLATEAGAVYIFELVQQHWIERAKLTAFDGAENDQFGGTVAMDGGTLVVGAPNANAPAPDSGAVYLFERGAGGWALSMKLTAAGGQADDRFGGDVDLDAGLLAVTAPDRPQVPAPGEGAVYVYRRNTNGWVQEGFLEVPVQLVGTEFGQSVAVDGSRILVGERSGHQPAGARLFELDASGWTHTSDMLPVSGRLVAGFGADVAINGSLALVGASGAPFAPRPTPSDSGDVGAGYVFVQQPSTTSNHGWAGYSTVFNVARGFSQSVALSDRRAAFGAPYEEDARGLLVIHDIDDAVGEVFCHCSSDIACNNGNNTSGMSGCRNSTGVGAELRGRGTSSLLRGDLTLSVSSAPPGAPLFLVAARGSGAPYVGFGEGVLCIDPGPAGLRRVAFGVAGPGGSFDFHSNAVSQTPGIAGSTVLFQAWYGDPASACGLGGNLTNGLAVTFLP
ncbi:MAG: hypothetical protein ACI8WY_003935 [Planctomycetota bacterium]|jgi:hypothetical protein